MDEAQANTHKREIKVQMAGTLVIDERHLKMIMSPGWQTSYYEFSSEAGAISYAVCCLIALGKLDGLDGHANLPKDWVETRFFPESQNELQESAQT